MNSVVRQMPDLRVGDVVLFHWNINVTAWNLIKSLQIIQFFRHIPSMITGWLNRYGSSSYWNHAALVYASPFETQESHHYDDVLFLEALPESGVGIHGPEHYLGQQGEWSLAVIRLKADKAPWLSEWERRLLFRRVAVKSLDDHYDLHQIMRLTIYQTARMFDQQGGKPLVAGIVRGGVFGVILLTLAAFWWIVTVGREEWGPLLALTSNKFLEILRVVLDKLFSLWQMGDYLSAVVMFGFDVILLLAFLLSLTGLLWLASQFWVRVTFAIGAVWGAVVVPVMADLSNVWEKQAAEWRWAATAVWCLGPPLAPFVLLWWASKDIYEELSLGDPYAAIWKSVIMVPLEPTPFAPLLLLTVVFLAWFSGPLIRLLTLVLKVFSIVLKPVLSLLKESVLWFQESTQEGNRFICSGLVQYALARTAEQIPSDVENVIVNPNWTPTLSGPEKEQVLKGTLPKDFANSDKFEWVYLVINGKIIYRPSSDQIMQAPAGPLKRQDRQMEDRKLARPAIWSFRWSLLGLSIALVADVFPALVQIFASVFGAFGFILFFQEMFRVGNLLFNPFTGTASAFVGLVTAYRAKRQFMLNPESLRGEWLARWGRNLAYLTLLTYAINLIKYLLK